MPTPTEPEIDREEQEEEGLRGHMSFFDHLEELRTRIINILIVLVVAFGACWLVVEDLFRIAAWPITNVVGALTVTSVTDAFNLQVKVAFVAAVFIASPFLIAQIWLFVSPGLYKHERRYALPFVFASALLFVCGGVFGYYIALPFAIEYLVKMGRDMGLTSLITATSYFDLLIVVELGLGIVFQIPPVIFVLSRLGIVTPKFLVKNIPYALLIAVILAAILTPTGDIPNLMVMAVPMIGLYLLGVVVAFLFGKKRVKKPEEN